MVVRLEIACSRDYCGGGGGGMTWVKKATSRSGHAVSLAVLFLFLFFIFCFSLFIFFLSETWDGCVE